MSNHGCIPVLLRSRLTPTAKAQCECVARELSALNADDLLAYTVAMAVSRGCANEEEAWTKVAALQALLGNVRLRGFAWWAADTMDGQPGN